MKKLIFLLLPVLVIFACQKTEDPQINEPTDTTQSRDTLSYLALGDSYTIGQSVPIPKRWPNQLADTLSENGIEVAQPLIIAQTGWTTTNLQNGINAAAITGEKFDLVSLLIGVNNQFQGRPLVEYEEEFTALLDQAIAFADNELSRVFVVSIPDYAFTPFGANTSSPENISMDIDEFNAAAAMIALEKGVDFFNITDISRMWEEGDNSLIASDNLHPSSEQYRLWVQSMYDSIKARLEE